MNENVGSLRSMGGRSLRVGCDVGGILCPFIALFCVLKIDAKLAMVSENDKNVSKLIADFPRTDDAVFYGDVKSRHAAYAPGCDLFVVSAPCTPWSSAGTRSPETHPDAKLVYHSLAYICVHKPKAVVFENVPQFRNSPEMKEILLFMKSLNYAVEHHILNSKDYSVPQNRPRLYVICWLDNPTHKLHIPSCDRVPRLLDFIRPHPEPAFKLAPDRGKTLHRDNVMNMLNRCTENDIKQGMSIDAGCSLRFAKAKVNMVGTLTRAGCARGSIWATCKGGYLDHNDMERLQGIPPGIFDHLATVDVSVPQYRAMLGNAITVPVFASVAVAVLDGAGLLAASEKMNLIGRLF